MTRETDARIVIDRLLKEAKWDIENKAQVSTEEPTKDGRADYLLKNTRTQPLTIVEAKRFPLIRIVQRSKPKPMHVHLVFLSLSLAMAMSTIFGIMQTVMPVQYLAY